jgi:hypothetical protein
MLTKAAYTVTVSEKVVTLSNQTARMAPFDALRPHGNACRVLIVPAILSRFGGDFCPSSAEVCRISHLFRWTSEVSSPFRVRSFFDLFRGKAEVCHSFAELPNCAQMARICAQMRGEQL